MRTLISPPRSKVTSNELFDQVAEYFDLGLRIRPGDTILDVGANIGAFALRVAERTNGDVRILAFEPSPETFTALAANFAANVTLRKTRHRLFHLGLSSKSGETASFYDFAHFPTNSTFHLGAKRREFEMFFEDRGRRLSRVLPGVGHVLGNVLAVLPRGRIGWWFTRHIMGLREHTVRLDTLAHVLADEPCDRIDLLKIDVEGPELEILHGLDESAWRKVQQVVLETHDRDGRLALISEELRRHGLAKIRHVVQRCEDNGLESFVVYATR